MAIRARIVQWLAWAPNRATCATKFNASTMMCDMADDKVSPRKHRTCVLGNWFDHRMTKTLGKRSPLKQAASNQLAIIVHPCWRHYKLNVIRKRRAMISCRARWRCGPSSIICPMGFNIVSLSWIHASISFHMTPPNDVAPHVLSLIHI